MTTRTLNKKERKMKISKCAWDRKSRIFLIKQMMNHAVLQIIVKTANLVN